jgi:hypothetical protein
LLLSLGRALIVVTASPSALAYDPTNIKTPRDSPDPLALGLEHLIFVNI